MTENSHDWSIILAAGGSVRFGSAKALAPWQEGTLLSNIVEIAKDVFSERIIVVTGGYAKQVQDHLKSTDFVFNAQWENGIGTSIAAGTAEVLRRDPSAETITILPVDQPFITARHLGKIVTTSRNNLCVLSKDDNTSGPPATIPSLYFPRLLALNGTKGLKALLHSEEIELVPAHYILKDIDTVEDLLLLKGQLKFQ